MESYGCASNIGTYGTLNVCNRVFDPQAGKTPAQARQLLCCATVVSTDGTCCVGETPDVAPSLDRAGACCASGSVDACGVCDGNGLYLDAVRTLLSLILSPL
eukprot:1209983-Pyramimonas_sp.AAC.1